MSPVTEVLIYDIIRLFILLQQCIRTILCFNW